MGIRKNKKYMLTGRYMCGKNVTGYHISSCNDEKEQIKVSREVFVYMLGQESIVNCTAQIYDNNVLVRCTGKVSIDKLPVFDETINSIKNIENISSVIPEKKNADNTMNQYTIVCRLTHGKENIGYEISNHAGYKIRMKREEVIKLAEDRLITNAISQNYKKGNKVVKILRGAGINLRKLPEIKI